MESTFKLRVLFLCPKLRKDVILMNKITKAIHNHKWIISLLMVVLIVGVMAVPCLAADEPTGDVASAVESTWTDAKEQVKTITNNVVFPVIDTILAILFFVKVGTSYFEYRKHGHHSI